MDIEYYARQSEMTTPGKFEGLYEGLPTDVPSLVELVRTHVIHILRQRLYGVEVPIEHASETFVYSIEEILGIIRARDARPLREAREPVDRFVGTCRHYSLFACSLLRRQGIAARLRNCFANYLKRNECSDHWLCEYFNEDNGRWCLIDAQLDRAHRDHLGIDFDTIDVPHDKALLAGEVWRQTRSGRLDPSICGSLKSFGMDYVVGNLVRDLCALNQKEMLPWDGAALSEIPYEELSREQIELLSHIAELTSPHVAFDEVRRLYDTRPELHAKSLPNLHRMPA